MPTGTVKWFNATKGFGFIAPANGNKDVFVHISAKERAGIRQRNDGQAVTFDSEAGRDGRPLRREGAFHAEAACYRRPSDRAAGGGGARIDGEGSGAGGN